jgi:hypothetical protein
MSKRGRILRDASNGPGLLTVDGQQFTFALEGVWKSSTLPTPGGWVDVDFGPNGTVASVAAVPESQLAKEQAEQALTAAKAKGAAFASSAVATFGLPTLAATGALILGWFFLSTVTLDGGFLGKMTFTFWKILSLLNSSNALDGLQSMQGSGSTGFYGFLAFLCLAGPFVGAVWKDKRATLGGVLPVVFMVIVLIMVRSTISSATAGAPAEVADAARSEIMKSISLGLGAYVSILAAIYLGFQSVRKFLAARANG